MIVRTVKAAGWLTASMVVRLLREGLVLRSMIFPGIISASTLVATLLVLAWMAPGRTVLVTPGTPEVVRATLVQHDFRVRESAEAAERVRAGSISLGTDGRTLWVYGAPPTALEVEALLREQRGATWSPLVPDKPRARDANPDFELDFVCRAVALLFSLYGMVFGLGGVARDRDAGVLEAELALPIPRWVGGFSRWLASSFVLCSFFGLTVVLIGALLPLTSPWSVLAHGWAACCGAVAIGVGVVGTSGLRQGFSGPFALAMTVATGLGSAGAGLGLDFLPLGSLLSHTPGYTSLGLSLVFGLVASFAYGRRSGGGR